MNSMYLRALPHDELWKRTEPFLKEAKIDLPQAKDPAWRDQALTVFKTSMQTLADAPKLFDATKPAFDQMTTAAAEALLQIAESNI